MKWANYILTLVFISLAFLPAVKGMIHGCCEDSNLRTELSSDKHNHDENHCPTSCFCSCCSISFLSDIKEYTPPLEQTTSIHQPSFYYQNTLGILFEYDIWQPPRV